MRFFFSSIMAFDRDGSRSAQGVVLSGFFFFFARDFRIHLNWGKLYTRLHCLLGSSDRTYTYNYNYDSHMLDLILDS